MKYEIRPLVAWTDPETHVRRGAHLFRASWDDTLALLSYEIEQLGGEDPAVFQIDVQEADLRRDGMLRTHAKVGHPGVVVSFVSRFGPLRYATDAYERQYGYGLQSWQANIRAIALALEALRAVDRYGVSKRGEQYTGWKALPAGGNVTFPSADEALRWMQRAANARDDVLAPGHTIRPSDLYRTLARRLHPDAGGDKGDWDRLQSAKLLLTQAGML
ncbi:MAG: heat shock protein DnaJ protein [Streptosporangiaceae bacterium]|nr:heat shock protein DnaJ protein [Streptosporangiaceae bacterium]